MQMDLVHPGSHSDVLCMYKTSTSTHSHPLNRIKKVVVYGRAQRAKGKSGKKKKKSKSKSTSPITFARSPWNGSNG